MANRLIFAVWEYQAPLAEQLDRTLELRSIEDYQGYLIRELGWIAPLEHALARMHEAHNHVELRARTKRLSLEFDLVMLGFRRGELGAQSACTTIPPFAELGTALGWMFVAERSRLCHELIAHAIGARMTMPNGASAYFSHYPRAAPAWAAFTATLDRIVATDEELETLSEAARAAYRSYLTWHLFA